MCTSHYNITLRSHILKSGDLVKLIIFIASLGTLSETGIFKNYMCTVVTETLATSRVFLVLRC